MQWWHCQCHCCGSWGRGNPTKKERLQVTNRPSRKNDNRATPLLDPIFWNRGCREPLNSGVRFWTRSCGSDVGGNTNHEENGRKTLYTGQWLWLKIRKGHDITPNCPLYFFFCEYVNMNDVTIHFGWRTPTFEPPSGKYLVGTFISSHFS